MGVPTLKTAIHNGHSFSPDGLSGLYIQLLPFLFGIRMCFTKRNKNIYQTRTRREEVKLILLGLYSHTSQNGNKLNAVWDRSQRERQVDRFESRPLSVFLDECRLIQCSKCGYCIMPVPEWQTGFRGQNDVNGRPPSFPTCSLQWDESSTRWEILKLT